MMEEESVSPLLYDTSDILVGIGAELDSPRWKVGAVLGRPLAEDRVVTAERIRVSPVATRRASASPASR